MSGKMGTESKKISRTGTEKGGKFATVRKKGKCREEWGKTKQNENEVVRVRRRVEREKANGRGRVKAMNRIR